MCRAVVGFQGGRGDKRSRESKKGFNLKSKWLSERRGGGGEKKDRMSKRMKDPEILVIHKATDFRPSDSGLYIEELTDDQYFLLNCHFPPAQCAHLT